METNSTALTQLKKLLFDNGNVLYFGKQIEMSNICAHIEKWLTDTKKQNVQIFDVGDVKIIQYKASKGIISSLGLVHAFDMYLINDKGRLFFDIFKSRWCENSAQYAIVEEFEQGNILSASYEKDIEKCISDYLFQQLMPNDGSLKIIGENRYRESLNSAQLIAFLSLLAENETILVHLGVSVLKEYPIEISDTDLKLSWYFTMTSEKVYLSGWDKRNIAQHLIDLSGKAVSVRSELGRNTVKCEFYSWLTNLGNASVYKEIEHLESFASLDRIRELARLLKIKKSNLDIVYILLDILATQTDNPFDELTLLFVELAMDTPKNCISKNTEDERLNDALKKVLNYEKTTEKLTRWSEEWNISYIDLVALVKLLLQKAGSTIEYKRIMPFHKQVRAEFRKQNKDAIAQAIFEIEYCRHLIKVEETDEAIGLLTNLLPNLPDESMLEILPPDTTEYTEKAGSQYLKLQVIDLLLASQVADKTAELLLEGAKLQPLSEERLEKLIGGSVGSQQHRAEKLRNLLKGNELQNAEYETKYTLMGDNLSEQKLELIKHQASRPEGIFASLQKWLAEVKIPEVKEISKYADKLNNEEHAQIKEEVEKLSSVFRIEKPEIFVARGENKTGVTAYEGEHPFFLIGAEHLNSQSNFHLKQSEWRFVIASEMCHLYFHHARITSSDLWKGAAEKSLAAVDAMIKVLPALGLVGNALKRISYLNSAVRWLKRAEKAVNFAGNSKTVIDTASQIVSLYNADSSKQDKKTDKQSELLATSRIMQLTADRAGLVVCGEPKAAIRAIFKTSDFYNQYWNEVETKGLIEVLRSRSDDNLLKFSNLAIRIASLFSFYLSEEYLTVRKDIVEL